MKPRNSIARFGGISSAVLIAILTWTAMSHAQTNKPKSYFKNRDGVPLLTNRPEAYRNNDEYKEVFLNFNPIVVSGRFSMRGGHESEFNLLSLVEYYARQHDLDANTVLGVIRAESNFDPNAVSSAGARGLMQLMPGTAAEMNVTNVFSPEQNVAGGTQYLAKLLDLFDNDIRLALAAYNAGPGTVQKYGGIPPYKETQAYVKKVIAFAQEYDRAGASVRLRASAQGHSSDFLPEGNAPIVIHFKNGTTQPADTIEVKAGYYVAAFDNRRYVIRKTLVDRIARRR